MSVILEFLFLVILVIIIKFFIGKILGRIARNYFYKDIRFFDYMYTNFIKYKIYVYESVIVIGILVLSIINDKNVFQISLYTVIAILMMQIYIKIRNGIEKKQVLRDLLNITECLRVQISSQISLNIALRNLPELCRNKTFSSILTSLYLEYELYKFEIDKASMELQNRFNYSEIKMFVSALRQQNQHTSMLEMLDNLIDILREEYIEFLEDATKSKMTVMIMGVFIIVLNVAAIGIYPVIVESFTALNSMFS